MTRIDPDGISWIQENIWADYSAEVDRLYGRAWLELQREYLTLSRNSTHVSSLAVATTSTKTSQVSSSKLYAGWWRRRVREDPPPFLLPQNSQRASVRHIRRTYFISSILCLAFVLQLCCLQGQ